MEKLYFTVQDAKALVGTCTKYLKTDSTEGISQNDIQALQVALDGVVEKDTRQKKAMEMVTNFTEFQKKSMDVGLALIRKTQNAVKAAYGEDNKSKMREFHIGGNGIRTVKAMMSELKYMKGVATDHKGDLTKSGLKDNDIANFGAISTALSDSDTQQENAKKIEKRSTKERDNSMKTLQKAMRRIRRIANSVFADQPSVLIEFEPMIDKHYKAKKQSQTPPTQSGRTNKQGK